jgi:hypothetical protein
MSETTTSVEDQRKPPDDALWSLTLDTRFGPDYVWLEPFSRIDGSHVVELGIDQTTDPIDGSVRAWITLDVGALVRLRAGIDKATDRLAATRGARDADGPMFGTATDDDLAEIVHDAMCSGLPYRERCRLAARRLKDRLP